jgi:hypothetical protein
MHPLPKVKVCTPHGTGWATEITDDDFVWVQLEDKAVWIHVADVQVDRQQFSVIGSRTLACSVIAVIFAFLIIYWLLL